MHTQKGKEVLNWLARPKRFWRAWGNLGIGAALVVMALSFLLVVFSAYQAVVNPQPSALNEPRNALAIPGVNDFLPLSVAPEIVAGLVLALVVHEGGHGLFCRVEDINIKSMGLALIAIIPMGAFVEPDESELLTADRGAQTRMYAAGVTNNFALSFLVLLLLFGPVAGSIAVVDGVPVGDATPGSAAAAAGLDSGDVITGINGQPVNDSQDLKRALEATNDRQIEVQRKDSPAVTVDRKVLVVDTVQSAPIKKGTVITAVNDTTVYTEKDLVTAARNTTVGTVQTDTGTNITTPLGAYGLIERTGPLAAAGAPPEASIIVISINGERTHNKTSLDRVLDNADPGENATVVGYIDGERKQYNVTLEASSEDGNATLGGSFEAGISGVNVDDFGVDQYPAGVFLQLIGGDAGGSGTVVDLSFARRLVLVFSLPVIGVASGAFNYNFSGFTGIATEFYTVNGPLAVLGEPGVFLLANILFWTGWINLVVGQFNLVPTFPLDGGHILRTSTESVVSRLPVPGRRQLTTAVTLVITASMVGGLFMMVFGPRLFS